jgi:hypothetical protein
MSCEQHVESVVDAGDAKDLVVQHALHIED